MHQAKRPRNLRPRKHLKLNPALERNFASVVSTHPKSVHCPCSWHDRGILVHDVKHAQAFLDEVDENARPNRRVKPGELRGVLSTTLRLGLVPHLVVKESARKVSGSLTNSRRDCVNWDWAVAMIWSPSASVRELGGYVTSTDDTSQSDDNTYSAPERSGSAYMRSPLFRKDWASSSANPRMPRSASWLGLMNVNSNASVLSLPLASYTNDARRYQVLSCDYRAPQSEYCKSELHNLFA